MTPRSTFSIMFLLRCGWFCDHGIDVEIHAKSRLPASDFVAVGQNGGRGEPDLVEAGAVMGVKVFDPPLSVVEAELRMPRRDGFILKAQVADGVTAEQEFRLGIRPKQGCSVPGADLKS